MTRLTDQDLAAIRAVVREEIRAFDAERRAIALREPTDEELTRIGVKLTALGLRLVEQPPPPEDDNVVAFRPSRPVDPDHPPCPPPPRAA